MPSLVPPPASATGSSPSKGLGSSSILDDDDDEEGWLPMPVIRSDDLANGLDDEDKRRYHYVPPERIAGPSTAGATGNATGNLIDFDDEGVEWREKAMTNESEYTRLRLNEENENDEVHLRTKYLFDEDKAMTPLSQMQATKDLLTEAQRIAYVGLCSLACREMVMDLKRVKIKEFKAAIEGVELWAMKIMGRLYYHMELETQEQKMIESLAEHGVMASDLVPALLTTHTVANPEYDPVEARKRDVELLAEEERKAKESPTVPSKDLPQSPPAPSTPKTPHTPRSPTVIKGEGKETSFQTTPNVLAHNAPVTITGVSTTLSSADKDVTLDIRWTVLCDLFLIIIADSVYDSRSRVILELVANKLGLGWLDVVKFEQRVTEALEIQESVEKMESKEVVDGRAKAAKKRRYAMLGLATLGGGLVIGLSAGLLAPVIGAGLGAALTTIGVSGTTGFLAGAGGAAVITTAGTLTGSGIALKGMARRTRQVQTFELQPLHNNKRVNCIVTVSGFMTSKRDDVRLPFSVLDPVVGDVFSVHWEPEMLSETGSTIKILTSEVLSQVGQTVLQATVMTALMSALQWPILLTKLGYLIDNPWSNALDRARAAGGVLADVLMQRHLGVRPITLIGFSLGARAIFYCLVELAKHKAFGIVQDVIILGATLTAPRTAWLQARSVVAGRFVNGYARNDWVLNYLFRAASGGLESIAGLRPVKDIPGLENVDVTDKISGHMSYRTFMPLILDQLGFPVSADYFDEPDEPDMDADREVVRPGEETKKRGWFGRRLSKKQPPKNANVQRPPSVSNTPRRSSTISLSSTLVGEDKKSAEIGADDLPERLEKMHSPNASAVVSPATSPPPAEAGVNGSDDSLATVPLRAGFDLGAIREVIAQEGGAMELQAPRPVIAQKLSVPNIPPPSSRSESAPPPLFVKDDGAGTRSASAAGWGSSPKPFATGLGATRSDGNKDAYPTSSGRTPRAASESFPSAAPWGAEDDFEEEDVNLTPSTLSLGIKDLKPSNDDDVSTPTATEPDSLISHLGLPGVPMSNPPNMSFGGDYDTWTSTSGLTNTSLSSGNGLSGFEVPALPGRTADIGGLSASSLNGINVFEPSGKTSRPGGKSGLSGDALGSMSVWGASSSTVQLPSPSRDGLASGPVGLGIGGSGSTTPTRPSATAAAALDPGFPDSSAGVIEVREDEDGLDEFAASLSKLSTRFGGGGDDDGEGEDLWSTRFGAGKSKKTAQFDANPWG